MTTKLSNPVTVQAAIKRVASNHETGERTITLSLPQSEAAKAAQLSIYDGIAFEVTFRPSAKI